MYTEEMLESIKKVEAKRAENAAMEPRRMTAEEKDQVLKENHPDYREDQFDVLTVGPNKGEKAPKELVKMLQSDSRLKDNLPDLSCPDYETDVLIIGGGGAGASAAIEADNAGEKVMIVTKLRIGDANTMMAEGGIQAADKPNDSPAQHFLDCYGGGHFAADKELVYKLVTEAPEGIEWLQDLGVEFDKDAEGNMITTHGGGTSRKRMHAAKDYSGAEIMRTLRDHGRQGSLCRCRSDEHGNRRDPDRQGKGCYHCYRRCRQNALSGLPDFQPLRCNRRRSGAGLSCGCSAA